MDIIETTFYDPATGRIIKAMRSDPDTIAANAPEGAASVAGWWAPEEFYISGGEVLPIPPQPTPVQVFDHAAGEWYDPRTLAEYQAEVLAIRSATYCPKIDFLRALVAGGAFSNSDIVDLAIGYFPASVQSALSDLTPEEILDLQLNWIASPTVNRLDPLVTHVADALGTSNTDLDALFGVIIYPLLL